MNKLQQQSDSGIWKRGMILFIVIGAIAGVALFVALRRPGEQTLSKTVHPEYISLITASPQAAYPATMSWGVFYLFSDNLPSPKGWEIRYNATKALARRGSDKVRLDVLAEMLDEHRQMVNYRLRNKEGKIVKRETRAWLTVIGALKAFGKWHSHERKPLEAIGKDNPDLQRIYAAVQKLTVSGNKAVREEALAVQEDLAKKASG